MKLGWSNRFDEWIPRWSDRLAPFKTQATGGKESGGTLRIAKEKVIDDANDPDDAITVFRV